MRSKKGTLEQSVLDVWKDAAIKEQPETEHGAGEHAYEVGTDRYTEYTSSITPGQVKEEIKELNALIEELENEGILGNIAKAAGKTIAKGVKSVAKKAKDKVVKKASQSKVGKAFGKVKAGAKKVKNVAGKIKKAAQQGKAYGDEFDPMVEQLEIIEFKLNEYSRVLEEEMKNESLRDTIVNMWQEAASSAVDPKEREELDKSPGDTAKKMKRAQEPAPAIASEALSAKQKKLDVDGDGEIEGSDLAKLRKKAKKEDVDPIRLAQEFKVQSMRDALAQVWSVAEGELPPALKKAIDAKKKDKEEDEDYHDDDEKDEAKGGKTLTGKKAATINVEPKIKP